MVYREKREDTDRYKYEYAEGIKKLTERLEKKCEAHREEYIKDIMRDKERYRKDFVNLLGWPLTEAGSKPEVMEEKLWDEKEYSLYRVRAEIFEDVILTGLLLRHDDMERPFVIVQHGMLGTPELICGAYGETANYHHMAFRIFEKGANIFAPQLLLWSKEEYGADYDRQELDTRLKRAGSSVVSLELYAVMRMIDYYETQKWVRNIGMAGMSYGGFYALTAAAVDTRIKAVITCSFFSDGSEFVQTDLSRENEGYYFGQAEAACLVHPRKLLIEIGDADPLFDYRKSRREYERIKKICRDMDLGWLEFRVFEGEHEFYKDDGDIKTFIAYLNAEGGEKV